LLLGLLFPGGYHPFELVRVLDFNENLFAVLLLDA